MQLRAGARAAMAKGRAQLWRTVLAQTRNSIWTGHEQSLLAQSGPRLWMQLWLPQCMPRPILAPTPSPTSSTAQLHTSARAVMAEGKAQLWGTKVAQTRVVSKWRGGNHYWYLWRQCIRSHLEPLTVTAHTQTHAKHPHQPLLLQHCSPLGQGKQSWEGAVHTLKGNTASSDSTLWASTPATWTPTTPPIGRFWQMISGEAPAHARHWSYRLHLHPHLLTRW